MSLPLPTKAASHRPPASSRRAAVVVAFALALVFVSGSAAARRRPAPRAAPQALVELKADVNARKVRVGDVFQLDVELVVRANGQPEELVLPDLSDFKVVRSQRGPSMSSTTMINGRMSVQQTLSFTYLLRADTPGKKRIGSARARLGRSLATTDPILIEVVEKQGGSAPGRSSELDPASRFPEGEDLPPFFLDVRFDKDQVYTGEQAQLTVQLFAREQVDIDVRHLDTPKPPGFWVEVLESPSRVRPTQRSLRGQSYLVYPLMRLALFPLASGEHTLEPLTLVVTVARGGIWGRRQDHPLTSDPVSLLVLPLPEEGKPSGFEEGNVGRFDLSATVDKREVPLGQPVTLRVMVRGEGNLGAVKLPEVASLIEGARVFPPTTDEKKAVQDGRLYGEKGAELLVQPNEVGTFRLPSFSFPYFDPEAGRYSVARTEPISVRVTPSALSEKQEGARRGIAKGARPIHRRLAAEGGPLLSRPLFLAGLCAPALLGLALFAAGRKRAARLGSADGTQRRARKERAKAFAAAREARDLAAAERVLLDALAARFGSAVRALPTERLGAELGARGLESGLARELQAFLEAAQTARYAPKSGVERKPLLDDAARLFERIEEGAA